MNHNFQGAPDREDLRILDQMRRQLLPMIAVMNKLQNEMQFKMERGLSVDWPQIHYTTTLVSNYLTSFNTLINGGYQHTTEDIAAKLPKEDANGNVVKDNFGNPVDSDKEVTKTIYRDVHNPAQGDRIKALHPFPIPPFPMHLPHAQGMANTLLRKRLEPMEEGWVEKRLQKAAEFAKIPESWGIEPRKEEPQEELDELASDGEKDEEDVKSMPLKRAKGELDEDGILEMWRTAHQECFDREYLKTTYPEIYTGDDGGFPSDEEEDEDEDEDEEDFEDAMDTSGAPDPTSETVPAASTSQGNLHTASLDTSAAHQPLPGAPMLPLGFMHKFMVSGEVTGK